MSRVLLPCPDRRPQQYHASIELAVSVALCHHRDRKTSMSIGADAKRHDPLVDAECKVQSEEPTVSGAGLCTCDPRCRPASRPPRQTCLVRVEIELSSCGLRAARVELSVVKLAALETRQNRESWLPLCTCTSDGSAVSAAGSGSPRIFTGPVSHPTIPPSIHPHHFAPRGQTQQPRRLRTHSGRVKSLSRRRMLKDAKHNWFRGPIAAHHSHKLFGPACKRSKRFCRQLWALGTLHTAMLHTAAITLTCLWRPI